MRGLLVSWVAVLGTSGDSPTVWVFFSPESPGADRIFRELRAMDAEVRPVLLVERYFGKRAPGREFLETVRVSGEVRVVDAEGLRLARRLGIRKLPAVAVDRGGRMHVACGSGVDVREVMRCGR